MKEAAKEEEARAGVRAAAVMVVEKVEAERVEEKVAAAREAARAGVARAVVMEVVATAAATAAADWVGVMEVTGSGCRSRHNRYPTRTARWSHTAQRATRVQDPGTRRCSRGCMCSGIAWAAATVAVAGAGVRAAAATAAVELAEAREVAMGAA